MASETVEILLVEDNLGDARLLREALTEAIPTQFQLAHVQRLAEALERLGRETYTVILLDLGLPDSHGLDTLVRARAQAAETPIVVLTGFEDEALAIRAVQEGAQDYLVKGRVEGNGLARSIRYSVERKRLEESIRKSELEAARIAYLQESRRRIVAAQEQVRKEVAQELHGPIQTRLFLLQQRLRRLAKELSPSAVDLAEKVAELAEELDNVREEQIRRVSHRLHPSIIAAGLGAGLRSLRDHLEKGIPIEMEIAPEVDELEGGRASPIPEAVRLGLYRVAEEAMANVLKHAEATRVVMRLGIDAQSENLVLLIEDDGRGFDPQAASTGLGLTTIEDYLGAIGGSCTLETALGQGTKFNASIPLPGASTGGPQQLAG